MPNEIELPLVESTVVGNGQPYVILASVRDPQGVLLMLRRPKGTREYVASYYGSTCWWVGYGAIPAWAGDRWCRIVANTPPHVSPVGAPPSAEGEQP